MDSPAPYLCPGGHFQHLTLLLLLQGLSQLLPLAQSLPSGLVDLHWATITLCALGSLWHSAIPPGFSPPPAPKAKPRLDSVAGNFLAGMVISSLPWRWLHPSVPASVLLSPLDTGIGILGFPHGPGKQASLFLEV